MSERRKISVDNLLYFETLCMMSVGIKCVVINILFSHRYHILTAFFSFIHSFAFAFPFAFACGEVEINDFWREKFYKTFSINRKTKKNIEHNFGKIYTERK